MSATVLSDYNRTCRTCAKFKNISEMHPIFKDNENAPPHDLFTSNQHLAEFLFNYLKIKLYDGMPQKICSDCNDLINTIKRFFEDCETSRDILEKSFKDHIKADKPEIEFLSIEKLEYIEPDLRHTSNFSDDDNEDTYEMNLKDDESEYEPEESEKIMLQNIEKTPKEEKDEENSSYDCKICGKTFKREYGLKSHMSSHHISEQNVKQSSQENDISTDAKKEVKSNDSLEQEADFTITSPVAYSSESNSEESSIEETDDTPTKPKKLLRWECHLCQKMFKIKNTLYIHIKRIHGLSKIEIRKPKVLKNSDAASQILNYKCDICQKGFEKKNTLYIHKKRIHKNGEEEEADPGNVKYECDVCEKMFEVKNTLYKHKMRVHGIAKYECPHCKAKYNSDDKYKRHLKSHDDSSAVTYECKFCLKQFSEADDLTTHITIHSGSKPYVCTICSTEFTQRQNLKSHLRIHTGERKYKCKECNKDFLHRTTYQLHMQTHGPQPMPYQCEHCGKHFAQKPGLVCHLRTHTGEKPFKCDICLIGFSSKPQLLYHKKIIHGVVINENETISIVSKIEIPEPVFVEKPQIESTANEISTDPALPYVCTVCNKGFKLPFKLTKHFKMHTDVHRMFPCNHCEKTFRTLLTLRTHVNGVHLKLKPHSCKVCSKSFSQKGSLDTHMITHTGEKPHTCVYCNKSFGILRAMRDHMRIHTGEKPYCCEICKEDFRTLKSLASHQRTKHKNFTACSVNEVPETIMDIGNSGTEMYAVVDLDKSS